MAVLLLSDSTNAERKGYTMSERTVGAEFDKLFVNCTKRIVVATFASNVHRIQQIVNSAVENGRKIAVCGRSMINTIETAEMMGVPSENIFMSVNGRILEINQNEAKLTGTVPSGKILVDGLGVGDVGSVVLRDRQHLSQDGLIVIVMTMDNATGEIVAGPDVITRGFVYIKESENLMDDVKRVIREEVQKLEEQGIRDWGTIKSTLKDHIRDYIFQKTKRNPMILPIIMSL